MKTAITLFLFFTAATPVLAAGFIPLNTLCYENKASDYSSARRCAEVQQSLSIMGNSHVVLQSSCRPFVQYQDDAICTDVGFQINGGTILTSQILFVQ